MKIRRIEVNNFKAIAKQAAEFNGCSAIIIGGNNSGKTSLLRGLIDRFRSEIPEMIVKDGEQSGSYVMELTDGSRIEWNFNKDKESFAFITREGEKQTSGVLSNLGLKYFGRKFDIDKFLNSAPKEQVKTLQNLVGLDFLDVDARYRQAYDKRTESGRIFKTLEAQKIEEPKDLIEKPELESLEKELVETREKNKLRQLELDKADKISDIWPKIIGTVYEDCFDTKKASKIEEKIRKENKIIPTEPIEAKIKTANELLRQYDREQREKRDYDQWVLKLDEASKEYQQDEKRVENITEEKKKMIREANLPKDFDIVNDEIYYRGFPLSNTMQSSSSKYIAALKLGHLVMGQLKSLHFDASFLDKNSLAEIQEWANENDLQLLIERPDFDGGEIKYDIV